MPYATPDDLDVTIEFSPHVERETVKMTFPNGKTIEFEADVVTEYGIPAACRNISNVREVDD